METIRIKYFKDQNGEQIVPLEKICKGDWIDLRATETIGLSKGEFKMIPLGIAMELPKGYEALVVPRSSTFKNFRILQANSVGVIDNSYCGDNDQWHFPAYAVEDTVINKNDRICQFRIIKNQPEISFETVETLDNPDRNGLGSTGIR